MGLESARRGEKPTSHLCAPPSFRTIGHFGLMRSVQRSNSMYKKRVHYANKQTLVYCMCVINTEYIITNTTGGGRRVCKVRNVPGCGDYGIRDALGVTIRESGYHGDRSSGIRYGTVTFSMQAT